MLETEIFHFSLFFVPLAAPKVLSFDNKSKNFRFSFVLCSLIRTFAAVIDLHREQDNIINR